MKYLWEKYKKYKEINHRINIRSSFKDVILSMLLAILCSMVVILPLTFGMLFLIQKEGWQLFSSIMLFVIMILGVFLYFYANYFWLKRINKTLKDVNTRILFLFQSITVSTFILIVGIIFIIQIVGKV